MFNLLIIWLILYTTTWIIWVVSIQKGKTYETAPKFAVVYFSASVLLHYFVFQEVLQNTVPDFNLPLAFVVFIGLLLFNIRMYKNFKGWFNRPEGFIKKYPDDHNIIVSYRALISKSFEMLFQQISFAALFGIALTGFNHNFPLTLAVVPIGFAILHLPAFIFLQRFFATYYSLTSLFGAIIFSLALYYLPHGYLYAYAAHSLFYTTTAGILWYKHGGFRSLR